MKKCPTVMCFEQKKKKNKKKNKKLSIWGKKQLLYVNGKPRPPNFKSNAGSVVDTTESAANTSKLVSK